LWVSQELRRNQNKKNQRGNKGPLKVNESSAKIHKEQKKDVCHFCKKIEHYKKDCLKRKIWFKKKGKPNAWWIDSGCTTHISNTMQGFLMTQTTSPNERFVFMGNRVKASIEAIRTYRLILDSGHDLDIFQTLYVPSISRNLISLSKPDTIGYSFKFGNRCCSLFKHNHFIGSGVLCEGLYKLKLDNIFAETLLTLHHNIGTKHSLMNESSAYLWHKRLGHISKEKHKDW